MGTGVGKTNEIVSVFVRVVCVGVRVGAMGIVCVNDQLENVRDGITTGRVGVDAFGHRISQGVGYGW